MDAPEGRPTASPRVGSRVVVRHRLAHPDPVTGAHLTDVVGDVVDVSEGAVVVRTRRGDMRVPLATVTAVKEVPPRPLRRGAPHRALSVEQLQRVMVGAWPAMETEPLGDWLLRASRGFTQRANSVVTAGSAGMPVPDALDAVERWYAARGLPANLALAGPVGADLLADEVGAEARRHGYAPRVTTLTLTAPTRLLADHPSAGGRSAATGMGDAQEVVVRPELTEDWFAAYRSYRDVDEVAARAILTGSPAQLFASMKDRAGSVVGIGRLGVADGWGGVAAMWVAPRARRRGIGSAVLTALAAAGERAGAASLHLQTDTDNAAALAFYEGRGFEPHHAYVNVRRALT